MAHDPTSEGLFYPEAERAVLGAVLLESAALTALAESVAPEDFYHPGHALVFEAMRAIDARREPVDVVTLAAELQRRGRLETVGGTRFLGELTDAIVTTAHVEAHARIVRDCARRRRALATYEAATKLLREGADPEAVRAHVEKSYEGLDHTRSGRIGEDLDGLLTTVHRRASGQERPLESPWYSVNTLLGGGLWPGLYVLVGGTGAGKTQFAVQTAVQAAKQGARVLYLALELGRQDLAARVLGVLSGLPWSQLLRGSLPETSLALGVTRAEATLRTLPFWTECAPPYGYSVETLVARAWALRPALIVLDYLQLCGRPGEDLRASIARAAYAARALARDLGTVVLALSSTARENYSKLAFREETDPTDLVGLGKESGEVEYASDGVLVLTRGAEKDPELRRLVVAKNRCGPTGVAELFWDGHRFEEPEHGPQLPPTTTSERVSQVEEESSHEVEW